MILAAMRPEPAYACALLVDAAGHLLLEQRPAGARHASGRLTCFGGRVESGESAAAALRRELREELGLGLRPGPAGHVDLYVGGCWIARFFRLRIAASPQARQAGRAVRRLRCVQRGHPLISPWHRAVLAAAVAGRSRVRLAA